MIPSDTAWCRLFSGENTVKQRIGCFEVEELTSGRWKVVNTLNGYQHVTYGTEEEVREQAKIQTEAWERKAAGNKGQKGSAWRNRMTPKPRT